MLPRSVILFLLLWFCFLGIQGQQQNASQYDSDDVFDALTEPEENQTDIDDDIDSLTEPETNRTDNNEINKFPAENNKTSMEFGDTQCANVYVSPEARADCMNNVDFYNTTINTLINKFVSKNLKKNASKDFQEKINFYIKEIIKTIQSCYEPKRTTTSTTSTTTTTSTTSTTTTTTTTTPKPISTTTAIPIRSCGLNQVCTNLWNCTTSEKNEKQQYVITLENPSEDCHYLETCCDQKDIKPADVACSRAPDTFSNGVANPIGICMALEGQKKGVSNFGQFPWAVSIWTVSPEDYFVGGSLIGENVVLTTYNYFKARNYTYKVRAGDWDMATKNEVLEYDEKPVYKIIYDEELTHYIALLILKEKFTSLAHIKPINLPERMKLDYNQCIVTGWEETRKTRWLLKSMEVKVGICTGRRAGDSFLCAWDASSELGYSTGAPLVCPEENGDPNKYYQYGVWSDGTSQEHLRFVNVEKHIDWINDKILENKHNK